MRPLATIIRCIRGDQGAEPPRRRSARRDRASERLGLRAAVLGGMWGAKPPANHTTSGWTILESVVALSLLLVLMPAVFPPIDHELIYLRERLETESARLVVEGELGRARQELARGKLQAGERALDVASFYRSQAQLRDLAVLRAVKRKRGEALWEVTIRATWRSAVAPAGEDQRVFELTTWSVVR